MRTRDVPKSFYRLSSPVIRLLKGVERQWLLQAAILHARLGRNRAGIILFVREPRHEHGFIPVN